MKAGVGSGLRARPAKRASPSSQDPVCQVATLKVAATGAKLSVIL